MCHLSLFPHPTDRLTRSLCYLKVSKRKKIDGFETKKAFLKEIELQIYFNIQSPPLPQLTRGETLGGKISST